MSLNREHLSGIEGLNVINDPKGNKALNVYKVLYTTTCENYKPFAGSSINK